eukprot:m.187706 g.187706  ORF g.187706 m.187706 type:complete len:81 (+) comp14776_c0_seq4:2092-2334(+)
MVIFSIHYSHVSYPRPFPLKQREQKKKQANPCTLIVQKFINTCIHPETASFPVQVALMAKQRGLANTLKIPVVGSQDTAL